MTSPQRHDHIERLIPWYVNGTLNEAETDEVNAHLGRCPQCSASVEREVSRARELRIDPLDLPLMGNGRDGWQALAARLPRRKRRSRAVLAAVAVSVVVAVVAGTFLIGQDLRRPVYRTLTTPAVYRGPVVQLVFEPSTPERVMRQVVLKAGGTVIAGPTSTGIYRVGLPQDSDGRGAVERLKKLPSVRWVALEQP